MLSEIKYILFVFNSVESESKDLPVGLETYDVYQRSGQKEANAFRLKVVSDLNR